MQSRHSSWRFLASVLGMFALAGCATSPDEIVDEAIGKIRDTAYEAPSVDWPRERERARAILAQGGSTHDAITSLLHALKDGHSFHLVAQRRTEILDNPRVDDIEIPSRLVEGHGYVAIPTYVGNDRERMRKYARGIHARIRAISASGACGWIVDLRGNGGGNMYPMILGVAPLLGPGELGAFKGRKHREPWSIEKVAQPIMSPDEIPAPTLGHEPVAVLIGQGTLSSGEAVAVSFKGRPATRFFGQPTGGKSSGNEGVALSDGSMMLVMAGLMADRQGIVYGGPIPPDEAAGLAGVGDEVSLAAAVHWLGNQRCAPQAPHKEIK